MNLFGHIGGVWCLTVLPSDALPGHETPILVSGSCDRSARVWLLDGSRWPCVATLFGHQSTVRCVAGQNRVSDLVSGSSSTAIDQRILAKVAPSRDFSAASSAELRLVVTGSRDTTLRLWNAVSGHCIRVFQGHLGAIRCVQFAGTMVVSGSYDSTVRVWCILTGVCLRILSGHKNRVYTLLFDGSHIISASLDTTIRVWDAFTGHLKRTFCGHRSLTSEMAYGSSQRILVSSNADETIRVWNVDTGECMYVLAGHHKHQSAVTSVRLTRHFVVSSGDDGTVKLWDRHTGAYIRDLVRLDGAGRGGVIWRIVSSENRLVCAAGSRNGLETTKLVILQFNEPIGSLSGEKSMRHQCRSRLVQPAPSPQLSQVLAAHTFHTDAGGDSTPTD
ncbi:F-box and WD-40 domain protein 7 [Paragonimus westermani]|uniref:F-box and WD-40 domain protein 7 n=1 Tax=Paragonimus westermani TaxID=34504 RepID=A0A5J4N9U1_9TREM|nr:F-box and WD-40 domain protein 7 [Paragonimus westermani]